MKIVFTIETDSRVHETHQDALIFLDAANTVIQGWFAKSGFVELLGKQSHIRLDFED